MLFSERSIWTMIHGIGLGGGFLIVFSSAFYCLWVLRSDESLSEATSKRLCTFLGGANTVLAIILWLTVFVGTYISFPGYRETPPAEASDLSPYPKAVLLSSEETAWLHDVAMEIKEHLPWVAAMLMTAVAYISLSHRTFLQQDTGLRGTMLVLLATAFSAVALVALLGVMINKAAPLT